MDFTLTYHPTPDEVGRALQQGVGRQLRAVRVALPAVLAASGLACLLLGTVGLGAGLLAGAVAFPPVLTGVIRRTARRQLGYLCVPTTLHVTGDGYSMSTEQSTSAVKWSLFSDVVATPEFWLFFVNRQFAGFLPRRAFDPAQQTALDALFAPQPTPASR
uniref:YcxB family protein n=1 Tax=Nonomuraea pusilla TaxID=46177 RepID=UPI000A856868|nr:YcxB family protein [Nonomuraea pusilla]